MTSARNTDQTTTENMSSEVYEILVSRCDDEDFDGDWRYSAFCPDIDTAMDGGTPEEALLRVKDAIRVKLADYQADQISDCPLKRAPRQRQTFSATVGW